jgi:quinoprotein glucose dehydrogenase
MITFNRGKFLRCQRLAFGLGLSVFAAVCAAQGTVDWPAFNGQLQADHYSRLAQINRANVHQLKQAWIFDTGEKGGLQTNPLIIGRTLYAYTPSQKVVALDAATGELKWKFDSGIDGQQPARGLAFWTDGKEEHIFAGVMNYLYCLDARTGKPVSSFGEDGRIDLRKGLVEFRGEDYEKQSIALTSPGVIYKDLIIVGGRNPEVHPSPPGDIRAFDVHTGELRWAFHTIPRPGEPGYETWPADGYKTAGAANNWTGMSLDAERGIVYVPTGSAVMDFYGGDRVGDDLYADCLLALDANTGKLLWHFQGVHHDIWDRDFPAQPALFTLHRDGKNIDAVAQISKQSYIYVFNRVTGEPLFPIHEHPYPPSNVPGEVTSPTQPMPDVPAPFGRQRITEDMLTNRTPAVHKWAVNQFRNMQSGGQFSPILLGKLTVIMPGFDGGGEWSGPALDPTTDILYVGSGEMPWLAALAPKQVGGSAGARVYQSQCAVCHGVNRAGSPPAFPSLVDIRSRISDAEIVERIRGGKGRMPAFPNLSGEDVQALLSFLKTTDKDAEGPSTSENSKPEYVFSGYRKFTDPDGYPAITPPWGTLNAIDLKTGKFLWKIPLGEYPELARQGMKNTGSELYGGPIVTASGVLFIGATTYDRKFHAFDTRTGKLLWETTLPYSGNATPATYMIDGRQYVVIAASGARNPKEPAGSAYVAFTLPEKTTDKTSASH